MRPGHSPEATPIDAQSSKTTCTITINFDGMLARRALLAVCYAVHSKGWFPCMDPRGGPLVTDDDISSTVPKSSSDHQGR